MNAKFWEARTAESMHVAASQAAFLCKMIEELGIDCGYERSFKMIEGKIFANRFLLGVKTSDVSPESLINACCRLNLPEAFSHSFVAGLADANLVFFGFEDGEETGCVFKVYLEFWEKLRRDLKARPEKIRSAVLHLGFKWNPNDASQNAISKYICYPMLTYDEILERISKIYVDDEKSTAEVFLRNIIEYSSRRCGDRSFIYLEVTEDGNRRNSFDINVYKANIGLRQIYSHLASIRDHFSISDAQFQRLYNLVGNKLLGHLSGGYDRKGNEFASFYYEVD